MPSNSTALLLLFTVVLSAAVRRPLVFEPNAGQTDASVRFLARGDGLTTFLTADSAVLRLDSGRTVVFRVAGANAGARVRGVRPLRGRTSYFHGSAPAAWHSGVANYGGVEYHGIYHGIDLVYYAQERRIEFDFVVHPGADASRIRLDIDGSDTAEVGTDGAVAIRVGGETVSLKAPCAYQGDGSSRREVAAQFVRRGANGIGVEVARYDRTQPLTIDPMIVYATYLGGSGTDKINAIATDPAGNIYVTGVTMSPDFPSARSFASALNRPVQLLRSEAFVAKLSAGGSELEYSAYLGGSGDDGGAAIKVDANGFAYVGGTTKSVNFPTTSSAYIPKKTLPEEVFVAKLDPSGTSLVYSTLLGVPPVQVNSSALQANAGAVTMAVDAGGSIFVAGETGSTGFTPTLGAYQRDAKGEFDAFVMRLNPAGSAAIYATRLGGSAYERIRSIAIDRDGNAYVAGTTSSSDFPVAGGLGIAMPPPLPGNAYNLNQVFVAKLNSAGSSLVYSTLIAGKDGESAVDAMALDAAGSVYVTGSVSRSTTFPVVNQIAPAGDFKIDPYSSNPYLAKLDPSGVSLQFSWWLAGAGVGPVTAMALDAANRLHILTSSLPTFQPTPGAFVSTDAYPSPVLLVLDPSGSQIAYATKVPYAYPLAMALDSESNVYFAGASVTSNFKPTPGAVQPLPGGPVRLSDSDGFLMKIAPRNPKPELTSIEPQVLFSTLNLSSSDYSALLTLNGAGFAAASTVYWNSTPVPSKVVSDRRIDVTLTQDLIKAGVVPVSVSVPEPGGGRSNAVPLHIVNPPPSYVNLSPFTAPAGSGETFVTIRGTVLPDSVVRWNGVERPVRYVPPGYLELKVPGADLATSGFAEVTVTNPQPGGGTSPAARFIITPASGSATPIVSTSSPPVLFANSTATTINIAGSNFDSTTVAKWNGQARPTEFVDASNIRVSLTAEDLSRANTVDITVVNGTLESNVLKAFILVPVQANALAYDAVRKKLYASISAGSASSPNTIAVVGAGRIETFIPVGKNPGALALSGDGKVLYVIVTDEGVVRRIDLQAGAVDVTLPNPDTPEGYGLRPFRLRTIPGTADSIVVGYDRGFQIFDGGVPRPNAQLSFSYTPFGALRYVTPRHIYVGQQDDSLPIFYRFGYDLFGTTNYDVYVPASDPEARDFRYDNGLVYFTDGSKVEPISFAALPNSNSYEPYQISADLGTRTVYALSGRNRFFEVWDLDRLVLKASIYIPEKYGAGMVRLDDGLFAYASFQGVVFLRAPK